MRRERYPASKEYFPSPAGTCEVYRPWTDKQGTPAIRAFSISRLHELPRLADVNADLTGSSSADCTMQ